MNIDQATASTYVRPAARESRLRSFLFALGLAAFALVALLATAVLLFLSARSQMRFQVSPTDIKYAPAQRIPSATPSTRSAGSDDDDDDDEEAPDSSAARPGGYGGIIPGIPGIGGGPLFPTAPQAPAYTPAPAAPARTTPPPAAEKTGPKTTPEATAPPAARPEPAVSPRSNRSRDGAPRDAGRIRRVGDKSFKRDAAGVLVDTAYSADAGLEEVTLVAGSDPYVRLLESRQDLRSFFRLDDHLIVVVDNIVYRVVPKD